jgi:hypothetical protein
MYGDTQQAREVHWSERSSESLTTLMSKCVLDSVQKIESGQTLDPIALEGFLYFQDLTSEILKGSVLQEQGRESLIESAALHGTSFVRPMSFEINSRFVSIVEDYLASQGRSLI